MKRFVVSLLLFLAPLLLIVAYVEWKLSRIPNSYTQKRDIIVGPGVDARVVVLGSSRDLNGISPSEFDCAAVNLANVSESLFYDTEVMKRQLRSGREVRLVIQGLAHFAYEFELSDSTEVWRGFFYQRFLGTQLDAGLSRFDVRSISFIAMYGQRRVLDFARKGFEVNLAEGIDQRGWAALLSAPGDPTDEVVAKQRAEFHAGLMKPAHLRENSEALEEMLDDLDGRGITVVLAASPVSRAYARNVAGGALARMQAETAAILARHRVVYRDYTDDPRFDSADFFNCDHLTPSGAVKYSRILNEEVVRPSGVCDEVGR